MLLVNGKILNHIIVAFNVAHEYSLWHASDINQFGIIEPQGSSISNQSDTNSYGYVSTCVDFCNLWWIWVDPDFFVEFCNFSQQIYLGKAFPMVCIPDF